MDEESTRGMVIPSGITSLYMLIQAGNIKMRAKSSNFLLLLNLDMNTSLK
jgi:hypothetical protein